MQKSRNKKAQSKSSQWVTGIDWLLSLDAQHFGDVRLRGICFGRNWSANARM
jgi:hypothetical protein